MWWNNGVYLGSRGRLRIKVKLQRTTIVMANAEDALLINLRIVAQVKPHEKINAKDKLLSIESWGWVPVGLTRYWRADNRTVLLRRVVEIIEECKGHCKTCKMGNDNVRLRRFLTHLSQTIPGLLNLRQTYATDQQSVAHLELLIEYVKEASVQNSPANLLPWATLESPTIDYTDT